MNDIEVLIMLAGVGIASYTCGRYLRSREHVQNIIETQEHWRRRFHLVAKQRDDMVIPMHKYRAALEYYADAANWMSGKASKDAGDRARIAIGDLGVVGGDTRQPIATNG